MSVTDIERAERERLEAAAAVGRAEGQLAAGEGSVSSGKLHQLRDRVRHATLQAAGIQAKAERERVASRLAGLEELGAEVDALAGTAGADLEERLTALAAAAEGVTSFAADYDSRVRELIAAAGDLDAEPRAPSGPRATSGFVAATADGITHKRRQLRPVAQSLGQVIQLAVTGNVTDALAAASLVAELPPPRRCDFYGRGANGMLITRDGPLPPVLQAQIRSGDVTPLRESEIQAYLRGELS